MGLDMEIRHNGCEVIYMRKENAIRNWVAEHLEGFQDNGPTSRRRSLKSLSTQCTM